MKLQPYPEYKDSGVPWLGEIPQHWQALPNRALFNEVNARNHPEEPLLSVTISKGVIRQTDLLAHTSKKDSSNENKANYKLVQCRDIAYNKMRAWQGAVGVSNYRGIVSPAYIVVRLRGEQNPEYFHYLLRTPAFAKEAERWSYGITSDQWSLRAEDFKQIYCAFPLKEEQDAIVAFLTHADRRINRFIRAKWRLIELLNEQKQAIIHRAVTHGLDPNVRLKPSGIDWLGDVPEHWEVAPLRRFATKRCDGPFGSGLKSMHYTPQGVRVIRLQNIGHSEFRDRDTAYISLAHYASLGDHDVIRGDLLIAGLGDERIPAGRACVAPDNIEPAMVKADCFRFRLNVSRVESQFVAFQLSATAVSASAILSTGATRQRINLQTTAGRAIAIPPIYEQKEIVIHVTSRLCPLEKTIAQANREIDLLREYRTRLVTDVVTGKLDVRGVETPAMDKAEALEDWDTGEDAKADEMDEMEDVAL